MYFHDSYEDISINNVIYIIENIPTKETEDDFNEIFTKGCQCKSFCTLDSNCSCLLKNYINYSINANQTLQDNHDFLHRYYVINTNNGVFECNTNCKCKHKTCGNRLVQYGPRKHLEIRKCGEKGDGLFTTQQILKGNFICEYAGEVIVKSEVVKRFQHNRENNLMNYIIRIQEHFGDKISTTFIDPTYFGNIGRYLNHSCNPNCELIPIRTDCVIPKLCIFAKEDIKENTELTFDYGDGTNDDIQSDGMALKQCLCNEQNCRMYMPYNANVDK